MVWLTTGRRSAQKVRKGARISEQAGMKEIIILFSLYTVISQVYIFYTV